MSKKTREKVEEIIRQSFGGSANYYKVSPLPGYPLLTEGAFQVVNTAECYWLMDLIFRYQDNPKLDRIFQVWTIKVSRENTAEVKGYNDTDLIVTQKISYTDFPLNEFTLYLINGVILLPNEY